MVKRAARRPKAPLPPLTHLDVAQHVDAHLMTAVLVFAVEPDVNDHLRQLDSHHARAARNLFLRASTGESIPGDERHVVLPVLFVERESTG